MVLDSKKKKYLDEEMFALENERTVLAYITTKFMFFGLIILILYLFFNKFAWSLPLIIILLVIGTIVMAIEIPKIRRLKKERLKYK